MYQFQIPTQRMPNPPYNAGMPSSTQGMYQLPPQQSISYGQGYGNQPLFMGSQPTSQRPPSTQGQVPQQYVKPKEKRHILSIVDPYSLKDVTAEILKTSSLTEVTASPDSGSRSTPVATTTEVGTNTHYIVALSHLHSSSKTKYLNFTDHLSHQSGVRHQLI